jgi:hypothetical protein
MEKGVQGLDITLRHPPPLVFREIDEFLLWAYRFGHIHLLILLNIKRYPARA